MEEIKKELAELKELVSKLLEIQMYDHEIKYSYLNRPMNGSTRNCS